MDQRAFFTSPRTNVIEWSSKSSWNSPNRRITASTSFFGPVRKVQPGFASYRPAYFFSSSGVSSSGSTLMETKKTSFPNRSPREFCTSERLCIRIGQMSVQLV